MGGLKNRFLTNYAPISTTDGIVFKECAVGEKKPIRVENSIIHGDSREELGRLAFDSVDLIFTSPPYADSPKHTYGGIHPDKYVEWFLPFVDEFFPVLKPSGSFVLDTLRNSREYRR